MSERAGIDLDHIINEWADELEYADDWEILEKIYQHTSRWCNHFLIIYQNTDEGKLLGREVAEDVGDGESSPCYPDEWYWVEGYEETVTKYRKMASSA